MPARRALISGITGQDGSYLAELLLEKDYEVHGTVRGSPSPSLGRIAHIRNSLVLHRGDLTDRDFLLAAVSRSQPTEVYNLAAMSSASDSWSEPVLAGEVTGLAVTRLLDAVRQVCPEARFFQASSAEVFRGAEEEPQSERTPICPTNPYGTAKAYAQFITANYRDQHGLFGCSGILFNHESPRRGLEFVTRKVTRAAAAIKLGLQDELSLGNLDAERDWGFAGDYVEAMSLMLQAEEPADYVIATGQLHSVRELVAIAFEHAGLDAKRHVRVDPQFVRQAEGSKLVGDASKLRERLGWRPRVAFPELVRMMVDADIDALATTRARA